MRTRFREWYAPTADELTRLWNRATFVLDSNVLLGLYHYPIPARDQFLTVLTRLRERLWLPHQVGLEYQRNRERSLPQPRTVLESLISNIERISANFENLGLPEHHPVLNPERFEELRESVKANFDDLLGSVRSDLEKTPRFSAREILEGDALRDQLTDLYSERVGERFSDQELHVICEEGTRRYEKGQPPGYKDSSKEEPRRYNDLIIWKEILRAASSRPQDQKSTIFVTNDRKEDWWLRKNTEILGPRRELVREYMDEVGGDFFMYTPGGFLTAAQEQFDLEVSSATIEDVNRVTTTSAIRNALRLQRLVLPNEKARLSNLERIHEALAEGTIRVAGDLYRLIERLGEPFQSSYVSQPLFFSLINETYGSLETAADPSRRLREREVATRTPGVSREDFVRSAHTAWLTQALYRIRHEEFSDDDLLAEFFGDDSSEEAVSMLRRAIGLAEEDAALRGDA